MIASCLIPFDETNLGSQTEFLKQQLSTWWGWNIECARSVTGNSAAGLRHVDELTPWAGFREGDSRLAGKGILHPSMEPKGWLPCSEEEAIEPCLQRLHFSSLKCTLMLSSYLTIIIAVGRFRWGLHTIHIPMYICWRAQLWIFSLRHFRLMCFSKLWFPCLALTCTDSKYLPTKSILPTSLLWT